MNARHICLYLAVRIGRWNDLRLLRWGRRGGYPVLWHPIDRLSARLFRAANR